MSNIKTESVWLKHIFNVLRFFGIAMYEIGSGIVNDRIPAHRYCYYGITLGLVLLIRGDSWILKQIGFAWNPSHDVRWFLILLSVSSGWLIWGMIRAYQRNHLLNKLKNAFAACGWISNGKYPSLIEDVEVDDHVRKLRLKTHGLTKKSIEDAIPQLEAQLNITVVRLVQEGNDKSRIDILYTVEDLDKVAYLPSSKDYPDGSIPIGMTHEGPLTANFRDIAHMLVAGESGSGKSNFLKLEASVLSENNPEAEILFLDFKGGMEGGDLKSALQNMGKNIKYCDGTAQCAKELVNQGSALENRLHHLAEVGAVNFDQYVKLKSSKKIQSETAANKVSYRKTFLILDEVAQLFSKNPEIDKETADKARAAVNRIARQGRAAGVHMTLAVQKPDVTGLDQTVKANLPAILCFPMANQAASVSAVGTKRAYELNPEIKGRAVWKFGPQLKEVQTYLFT